MKYILMLLIKIYQFFFSFDHGLPHKLFPDVRICIFEPSCSAYGYESIKRYGSIIGGYLAFIRIMRCGPWSSGGIDNVKELNLTGWKKLLTKI